MAKPVAVDKWKKKKRFDIYAPAFFNEAFLGNTFAESQNQVIGRTMEVPLSDLTGDSKLQKTKLCFRISEVKGERANAVFLGHVTAHDYLYSLVRRRTSKIYTSHLAATKEGKEVRVKSIVITMAKVNRAVKNDLREKLIESINEIASTSSYDDFLNSVVYGKLVSKLKKDLNKVYPVRHVIIQKSEIPQPISQSS